MRSVSAGDALALKDALEKPEIATLRGDPLAVLVILGYADPKGDAKANLQFSKDRAEAVVTEIKKAFGDRTFGRPRMFRDPAPHEGRNQSREHQARRGVTPRFD